MLGSARNLLQHETCKYGRWVFTRFSTEAEKVQMRNETAVHSQGLKFTESVISTHPHLLKEGELMPGIKLEEFQQRRNDLMQRILSFNAADNPDKEQIVILPAATKTYMSENIPYFFRQNSNFLYFTGCKEQDAVLVISGKSKNYTSTLFVKEVDEKTRIWEGSRTNANIAVAMFGVDQSLTLSEFDVFFTSFAKECKECLVWYDSGNVLQPQFHRKLCDLMKVVNKKKFYRPTSLIHEMRLIKSEGEANLLKQSCDIISKAIIKTIQASRPGISEHELFAIVDYEARMNGAQYLAYPPVVAGGSNATTIHYINNDEIIPDGKVVLMDAGCDFYGYSSDVTRTWPINGSFSKEQRILYEIVLETQQTLIKRLEQMPTLDELFIDMNMILGKYLQEGGLIEKTLTGGQLLQKTYQFCPHHVSHYLGMDVHDTGTILRDRRLQPGMIVTVEPGVYIDSRDPSVPPEFQGIGIRIEDDVLITTNGPVVLSENCPKSLSDMEKLAGQKNQTPYCTFPK